MKLSCGRQCGRNGFMAYVDSGNRPVLGVFHEICWSPDEHKNFHSERFQSHWYVCGFHDSISQSYWKTRFFERPAWEMHKKPENLPIRLQGTEPLSESAWHRVDHIEWGDGSNKNANRLIRRWFSNGTDFSKGDGSTDCCLAGLDQ